jgi:hypothetical protein
VRNRPGIAVGLALVILIATPSAGLAKKTAQATIPFPSAGNVTVARLTIIGRAGSPSPKIGVLGRSAIPGTAFVAATIARTASARYLATVALFNPVPKGSLPQATLPHSIAVRLPAGFTLVGPPRVAKDVVYENQTPSFAFTAGGVGSILAGVAPSKLPPTQLVRDAQNLAFERSVPLVDVGLLGLQFVAAQFSRTGRTALKVTIGLYQDSQVNAVELRFPATNTVTEVSKPPGTDALLLGDTVRLISSTGFYQDGVQYSFTLRLSKSPLKGDFVTLRASTHYFEGSLPFTERFALS